MKIELDTQAFDEAHPLAEKNQDIFRAQREWCEMVERRIAWDIKNMEPEVLTSSEHVYIMEPAPYTVLNPAQCDEIWDEQDPDAEDCPLNNGEAACGMYREFFSLEGPFTIMGRWVGDCCCDGMFGYRAQDGCDEPKMEVLFG